jgi:predicted nucleic acid-binding protein
MPVLFDASIYIAAMRPGGGPSQFLQRRADEAPLWLSSVVLEELYAGASGAAVRAVERLEHDFERAKRVLVPNLSDWASAGKILARLAAKYGYERIGQARLTNDALIAMSAARTGITVLTATPRDFARIGEFRAFSWRT